MSDFDWKAVVRAVAPTLATALAGPLAGSAVAIIGERLLGKAGATEAEIAEAVMAGQPETLAQLKKIDADFRLEMERLQISLEAINQADRSSARDREIKTSDWMPKALALALVVGFFVVLGSVAFHDIPPNSENVWYLLLGVLGGAFTQVMNYYFGSSAGSAEKNLIISRRWSKAP